MENIWNRVSNSQRKTGKKGYKKIETAILVAEGTI